jgi:hypothetical protein
LLHPGSWIQGGGGKKAPDPGSATLPVSHCQRVKRHWIQDPESRITLPLAMATHNPDTSIHQVKFGTGIWPHIRQVRKGIRLCDIQCNQCCQPAKLSATKHTSGPRKISAAEIMKNSLSMAEWGPNFKKCVYHLKLGMHWILFLPDIRPAGYPDNPKARYRISG